MNEYDKKRLWARSGNICSFPGCNIELVPEKQANRVIGEQAHIRGEKPGAARHDPGQPPEERESYQNRILLCPTHHVQVDADPETWPVERLLEIKAGHEEQLARNRLFPQLLGALQQLVKGYEPSDESLDAFVPKVTTDRKQPEIVRVDASAEGGINTNIKVLPGQTMAIFARGLIGYDGGHNFANPEGILCNAYGIPTVARDPDGNPALVVWPHEQAYKTDGDRPGLIGSLFGWVGEYSPESAFFIGSLKKVDILEEGYLCLAVNDATGTYGDNDGEFRVDIRVEEADDELAEAVQSLDDWR